MYLIKERSEAEFPTLKFSGDLFHQAHELKADCVHVEGNGFAFDLEKVNNLDYNPVYFSDRWKGQYAFFPYENYDETALNSMYLRFLGRFSRFFISDANEYSVVLTGLILRFTKGDIYFTDERIRWFYEEDERLHVVDSFPELDSDTLTIKGIEQDLIFDSHFKRMGPIMAFHNVFFMQGHGVMDLTPYKYADVTFDDEAGIGSILISLGKCSAAMNKIGLELASLNNTLGQFNTTVLDKYFAINLTHEDANESNTVFFPQIAALKSTAFIYLSEPKIDLTELQDSFVAEMDEYMTAVLGEKRTLGVLIRGTDYINMFKSGTRAMSTPQEMATMLDEWIEKYNYEKIFLATEDKDILDWMRGYYKDKMLAVSQERHSVAELDNRLLLADLDRQKVGEYDYDQIQEENIVNYFYALYILSQCQAFVCSGYCNGYDLVMHFNQGKFEHVYLFQKGDS